MIVICREVNKSTGEIAIYPIEKEVTDNLIICLKARARLNEELRYFVTLRKRWYGIWHDDIIATLKSKNVTLGTLDRLGGIIEI